MTTKISIKVALSDGSTVLKSFDKIPGEISLDNAKAFAVKVLPLYKATSANVTVYNYESGNAEAE